MEGGGGRRENGLGTDKGCLSLFAFLFHSLCSESDYFQARFKFPKGLGGLSKSDCLFLVALKGGFCFRRIGENVRWGTPGKVLCASVIEHLKGR